LIESVEDASTDSSGSQQPAPIPGKSTGTLDGTVIKATGSWYDIRSGDETIKATIRGRFRLNATDETNPVVVGDRVSILINEDGTGVIESIDERTNKLSRRAAGKKVGKEHVIAANIDAAWIIQSALFPKMNPGMIDRFLVMAGVFEIPARVVINKIDLIDSSFADAIDFWEDVYADLGYPVYRVSAKTGKGISSIRKAMQHKTNVIVGPSGVGKSSLLNEIQQGLQLRTGEISESTGKGVHTTTYAALYPLSGGGFVADTPGLREFGLVDMQPSDLTHFFVEFHEFADLCKFPNCSHDHEPGCHVLQAAAEGVITPERYESYLNILASLQLGKKDVGR
jgi:ribosome biogenesis GTPase